MRFKHGLPLLAAVLLLAGCERAGREGDILFVGYRYAKDSNAYVSANATKYMGEGYATSLNAKPHVKFWGVMCDLTWVETEHDGSKKTKHVTFPASNIYELCWKED